MKMKKILLLLSLTSLLFANSTAETWRIIGVSGTSNPIEVLKTADARFVPSYQILRHLNIQRSEKGDSIIARFGKNEMKFVRNSKVYLLNETRKNLSHATIYRNGINYCELVSFCEAMYALTGLFFNYNVAAKEIRVSRTQSTGSERVAGIVVIDAGHGGRDPGAIGPGGTNEKDVVLPIALEIRKYLEKYPNIRVYMTREDDVFVPLRQRSEFANRKNADLFVSIHANASERNAKIGGYKMYFLSEANNSDDEWTARLENSVLELEGESSLSGLEAVLMSLANSEFIKESQEFSIMLAKSFERNMKDIQKLHTGVGQGNFLVLNWASMPAALVEVAFISNAREERLLNDKRFQKNSAESIGVAIVEFLRKYPNNSEGR